MRKDNNYYATEFAEGLLEQQKAIWDGCDRPTVKKQEKRWSRAVEKLIASNEGIAALAELLQHQSPKVAITAAVYLLDTCEEMKAVELLRQQAKRPEDDLYAYAAQQRLAEWESQKKQKQ